MIKKISLLLISTFSLNVFGECDWSKIQKTEQGYLYTKELHICVGNLKEENSDLLDKNTKWEKAFSLKDAALQKSEERADLWKKTSFDLEDRIHTMDRLKKNNEILYYGLGILTMFAATYAAGQLSN